MFDFRAALAIGCFSALSASAAHPYSTELTSKEARFLQDKIARFYEEGSFSKQHRSHVIDERVPKFNAWSGQRRKVNPELTDYQSPSRDPLVRLAGGKAAPAFKSFRCRTFWKHFKGQECDTVADATIEPNDDFSSLTQTWIPDSALVHDMASLPTEGKLKTQAWSGDYWRTRWGLTSYRYLTGIKYPTYETAVAAYQQPAEWLGVLPKLAEKETVETINRWSPSEKYDLLTGSENFVLTNEQKIEGASLIGEDGKVEDWYGLCHGWAAAALVTPAATKPVNAVGVKKVPLVFTPHEIRAMVALAWSNGDYLSTFAGNRCDIEKPRRHPNGRLIDQDCFDNNPATLHLALANMLGRNGLGFVMDAAFDAEISNQPVVSYAFRYFNPLNPTVTDTAWEKVAVPYDEAFKKADRFQKPLSRGYRKNKTFADERIKKIVGVATTLVYLDEADAVAGNSPIQNETVRVTYTYDLELEEVNGRWVPTGGEWHSNAHPDFLWMPERNSFPHLAVDDEKAGNFSLTAPPDAELKAVAEKSSAVEAYPLCRVVKALVEASSGANYRCN